MRNIKIILLVFISHSIWGQLDHSLPLMPHLSQRTMINPSYTFEDNLVIGLPAFAFRFEHSGDALKDAWSVEDKTLVIDTDAWVENLEDQNTLRSDFEIQSFLVGWKSGALSWSINHSFRNQVFGEYSKGMAEFIHFGNAPYVGDTMDLSFQNDWLSYSTLNLGVAWKTRNISIGARAHYLSGVQWLRTSPGDLSLYTNPEIYQLEFESDLKVQSSSFISAEDIDALSFEFTGVETYQWFTENSGFALDIGATFDWGEKWRGEVSVLDLGFIKWKDVNTYTAAESFEFDGLDFNEVADLDSLTFEEALDSLQALANITETQEEDVVIDLQPRILIGFQYRPSEKWTFNAQYMSTAVRDKSFSTYALGATYRPIPWWTIGANAAYRLDRWHYGVNTSLRIAMFQVYVATDHIPGFFSINALGSSSIRLGANMLF